MKVLVVDVGGRHVKILATGQDAPRQFDSGPTLTPGQMAALAQRISSDWDYDAVSIGYPGPLLRGRPTSEPHSLGPGWVGFDFEAAFRCPVRVVPARRKRAKSARV
jgi:predicted NBD/HSP70 family sugar kinase